MLCFALLFAVSVNTSADVIVKYEDWQLSSLDNGAAWEIRGYIGEDMDLTLINYIGNVRVISVGSLAFKENEQIESVTGVPLLQIIKEYAFLDAVALKTVKLPYTVYSIERGAFYGAHNLQSVNLQETTITTVCEDAFRNTALSEISIPVSCTSIGNSAFAGCDSLTKADIPDSVTKIAANAFDGCSDFVIYCNSGSYAHQYAVANDIEYVLIDSVQPTEPPTDPPTDEPTTAPTDDPTTAPTDPPTETPTDEPTQGPTEIPTSEPTVLPHGEYQILLGDTDGDGEVTILDATKIQRVLAKLDIDTSGMFTLRGDIEPNGLEILDATLIQRFLALLGVEYPIGEIVVRTV